MPIVAEDKVIAGPTLANAMIMAGLNTVGEPSTALFRKGELLDQAPEYFRFDGVAGHGIIDMVTWAALLLKGDAVYRSEALSAFRIHAGQRQHDPSKTPAQRREHQRAAGDVAPSEFAPPIATRCALDQAVPAGGCGRLDIAASTRLRGAASRCRLSAVYGDRRSPAGIVHRSATAKAALDQQRQDRRGNRAGEQHLRDRSSASPVTMRSP